MEKWVAVRKAELDDLKAMARTGEADIGFTRRCPNCQNYYLTTGRVCAGCRHDDSDFDEEQEEEVLFGIVEPEEIEIDKPKRKVSDAEKLVIMEKALKEINTPISAHTERTKSAERIAQKALSDIDGNF